MASYSILIKNGTVFDGKGTVGQRSDVGISEDKIKEIGELRKAQADLVIDASGKYVSPGFIDLTNHSDTRWTLISEPSQESLISQGITTILGGNCGSSLAPLVKAENIEGIQKWADISKININWQTLEEFLKELEKHKLGLNFATLVGQGTLRRGVIGDEPRGANEKEIEEMRFLLERSLKQGAFGISFSLGTAHGRSTSDEEVVELSKAAAQANALVKHHLEDEGQNILPALSRLISFAHKSNAPIHISHFKALGRTAWSLFPKALDMVERTIDEGYSITCDFFPYLRTGSNLYMLLPSWAREGGKKRILEMIKNPNERQGLIIGLKDITLHYDKIIIASTLHDTGSVGKTIKGLAEISGISPEEVILNLLEINELQVAIFNEVISEENLLTLAGKKYAVVASDGVGYDISKIKNQKSQPKAGPPPRPRQAKRGGRAEKIKNLPHPRSFAAFPKFFDFFVKEKKIMTWEEAVYKATGQPAKILGLKDRGVIKPGAFADLVIFGPETIAGPAIYQNPYLLSKGIDYVLINGKPALENGKLTPTRAGRILRKS